MKSNIILTGMPWSGKTTLWKALAKRTDRAFLDFDDDVIESWDRPSVAQCLEQLWEAQFLELENKLALELNIQDTVLATSGSVALCLEAMTHFKIDGTVIYIDTPTEIIASRLPHMKTDRIVLLQTGKTLEDVLKERRNSYEQTYDHRFLSNLKGSIAEIQEQFLIWFDQTVK